LNDPEGVFRLLTLCEPFPAQRQGPILLPSGQHFVSSPEGTTEAIRNVSNPKAPSSLANKGKKKVSDELPLSSLPSVTLPSVTDAIIPQATAALFNLPLASLVAPPPTTGNITKFSNNLDATQHSADNLSQDIETLQNNIASLSEALGLKFDPAAAVDANHMDIDSYLQSHDFGGTEEDQAALLQLLHENPDLFLQQGGGLTTHPENEEDIEKYLADSE